METIFPTDAGFEGFFFVGWHRGTGGAITRTGTVVVKRTYEAQPDANPAAGRLVPADDPLPVFMVDQPEGLLENADFEAGTDGWTVAAGVSIRQGAEDGNHFLAVSGTANGRVTQAIDLGGPVRGRSFVLSLKAKADAATSVAGVQLEAGGSVICTIGGPLSTGWQSLDPAEGVWPNGVGASSATLVLRGAVDAGRTVHYDDITLTEIGYEHDMAADKPAGDVIVLPSQNIAPSEVQVDGSAWLRRPAAEAGVLRVFGWERRDDGPRNDDAAFPDGAAAYPLPQALPGGFQNLFYNGYRRAPRQQVSASPPPYLPSEGAVRLIRDGASDYGFRLGGESLNATYFYAASPSADIESRWQRRSVPMHLDTLVIEPDDDGCYAVWRGIWEFDERAEDSYRRLVVSLGEGG
jgi:hypothetical protein